MRLGFNDARAGARRRTAICPGCGSDRARYSRRQYDGLWSRFFKVRPAKCFACGSYFPISASARAVMERSPADPRDLHIPFTPLEHEELQKPIVVDRPFSPDRRWWWRRLGVCRGCGSRKVRPARSPGEEASLARRLSLKDSYRCLECNAGFYRLNPTRLFALCLFLLVGMGGLSYAVGRVMGSRPGSNSPPRIKRGQIPPPPPPVFR
jgi:hypothetical protein